MSWQSVWRTLGLLPESQIVSFILTQGDTSTSPQKSERRLKVKVVWSQKLLFDLTDGLLQGLERDLLSQLGLQRNKHTEGSNMMSACGSITVTKNCDEELWTNEDVFWQSLLAWTAQSLTELCTGNLKGHAAFLLPSSIQILYLSKNINITLWKYSTISYLLK